MAEQIGKPKYRIGISAGIFWLVLAFFFDLFSLVPFVGGVVGPFFWICFSIYLWKIGCGFLSARRLAIEVVSAVGEMIPVVQELPLILAGVLVVILMIVFEDKTGIKIMPTKGKFGVAQKGKDGNYLNRNKTRELFKANGYNEPLNENGARIPPTSTENTFRPNQIGKKLTTSSTVNAQMLNVGVVRQPSQQPRVSVAQPSNTGTSYARTGGGTSTGSTGGGTSSGSSAGGGSGGGSSGGGGGK